MLWGQAHHYKCFVNSKKVRAHPPEMAQRQSYAGRGIPEALLGRSPRGLDRTLVASLAQDSAWVPEHQNIFLIGQSGIGKSFLACALAERACRHL